MTNDNAPLPPLATDKAARQLAVAFTNSEKKADQLYQSILSLITEAMKEARK